MAKAKYTVRTKRTRRTTEFTVEQETFVALRGMRTQRGWCNKCFAETNLATPEEAAAVSRVSLSMIYLWAEMGRLHFADADPGEPLLCFGSLQASE